LIHQDYNTQIVRLEWTIEEANDLQRLTFRVGNLNTETVYETDSVDVIDDDLVHGLDAGFATSATYTQVGTFDGSGDRPETSPEEFVIFDGGNGSGQEFWNELEMLVRDNQLWIWWNKTLIPPNTSASASLPTPISINTPYFPVNEGCGKFGMRMFPGALVRSVSVSPQIINFNEFTNGNIKVV